MQLYLLLIGVTIAWCKPSPRWQDDQVLFYIQDVGRPDGYSFRYQTEQGNFRTEQAVLRTNSKGIKYLEVIGSYSYKDNNGKRHNVAYKSDDKGYRLMKPTEPIEEDNVKFETRFQSTVEKYDQDSNLIQESSHLSQIGPKYSPLINSEEILDVQEVNKTKEDTQEDTQEDTKENTQEDTLEDTKEDTQEDIITSTNVPEYTTTLFQNTTLIPSSSTNDTLLKVSDKTGVQYDEEGVGNRVGLPPGLIGSLLGGGG